VTDDIHFSVLRKLEEARRSTVRFRVNIERLKCRGRPLRRQMPSAFGRLAEVRHLFGSEQLTHIRPAFFALRRAYSDKPAPVFENIQPVAMLGRRYGRRFWRKVLVKS